MKKIMSTKVTGSLLLTCFFMASSTLFAQSGIDAATAELQGYFDSIGTLIMAAGGLVGLVGGLRVFIKWNQGDPNAMKDITAWVGSMVFLVLVGALVEAFVA